ncbi:MAG: mandelate racemase/muconate lactonizing enzyme family protein [Thermomicrobiales bacterium]
MKITAVKGYPIFVGHRNQFVIKIETDEGISGVGEGGISGRELAMQGMLEHYADLIVGMDPRRIEHIWQLLYRGAYFEGGKIAGAVISAIDIALWDILGKSLNVPIWQLLGGAVRDRVPCFCTPGSLAAPDLVERAQSFLDDGWKILRFSPSMPNEGWTGGDGSVYEPLDSINNAVAGLTKLRKELGPDVALSIDFHHRLSAAESAIFCRRVEDLHLYFVEEPMRCEDPNAYAQLRTMTGVPLALGEEFSSKWAFAPYVERGLLNFARIDICNVGGISESRKVANWCETHYIDVMPHNPLGPISTAALVHLGSAITNFAYLEYFPGHYTDAPRDLFPEILEMEGTTFPLPTAPGLGVEFDEEAAKQHPYQTWIAPRYHREDGSYTNW